MGTTPCPVAWRRALVSVYLFSPTLYVDAIHSVSVALSVSGQLTPLRSQLATSQLASHSRDGGFRNESKLEMEVDSVASHTNLNVGRTAETLRSNGSNVRNGNNLELHVYSMTSPTNLRAGLTEQAKAVNDFNGLVMTLPSADNIQTQQVSSTLSPDHGFSLDHPLPAAQPFEVQSFDFAFLIEAAENGNALDELDWRLKPDQDLKLDHTHNTTGGEKLKTTPNLELRLFTMSRQDPKSARNLISLLVKKKRLVFNNKLWISPRVIRDTLHRWLPFMALVLIGVGSKCLTPSFTKQMPEVTEGGAPQGRSCEATATTGAAATSLLKREIVQHGCLHGPADLVELSETPPEGRGNVVEIIRSVIAQHPTRHALTCNAGNILLMRYSELGAAVSKISAAMQAEGLGTGDVTAIFLPPSATLVVAVLGAMEARVAWLPLDIKMPGARIVTLLRATGANLALATRSQEAQLTSIFEAEKSAKITSWFLGPAGELPSRAPLKLTREEALQCPHEAAAIFYTSGSSGVPKGVVYSASTILHGVMTMRNLCEMGMETVAVVKTPSIWAVTEYELFPALTSGGQVVCDAQCQTDLLRLAEVVARHGAAVLMTSAPVLKALLEGPWSCNSPEELLLTAAASLTHVVNVGGAMPLEVCASIQTVLPKTKIHNLYGCTECPCTQWTYERAAAGVAAGNAPAGVPQAEVKVCVVDGHLQPVAAGQVGEVCIGSRFNSLGYLGDRGLTSERFVHIGDQGHHSHRFYRTGDLGRFVEETCSSGGARLVLQITGRADRQLNISGVRVAPEEIETAILEVDDIQESAVVASGSIIVAYVAGRGRDITERVHQHCEQRLAERMRPKLVIKLDALPKLRNGKVDLKSLEARAKEAASNATVMEVADSLGLMKSVSLEAIQEMNAMSALRALAMIFIILYHWLWWFYMLAGSSNLVTPEFNTTAPAWLRWPLRGAILSQWSMISFVLMSARTDRQAQEAQKPGQLREMLLVLLMWMMASRLLGVLFQLFHNVLGNDLKVINVHGGHAWYLMFWMLCRVLSAFILPPLEYVFRQSGRLGSIVRTGLVLALAMVTQRYHTYPYISINFSLSLEQAYFQSWLYWLYVTAWFYQGMVTELVSRFWPKTIGPTLPLMLFVVIVTVIGWQDEVRAPLWFWRGSGFATCVHNPGGPDFWKLASCDAGLTFWKIASCDTGLAFLILLSIYSARDSPWLHWLGLVYMGKVSLGVYISHFFFWSYCLRLKYHGIFFRVGVLGLALPDMTVAYEAMGAYGGAAQLLVIIAYPTIFSLTIGALFQWAFMWCYLSAEHGFLQLVQPFGAQQLHAWRARLAWRRRPQLEKK